MSPPTGTSPLPSPSAGSSSAGSSSTAAAAWLVVGSTLLFAMMGVCVKLASADYPPGELVFYRSLTGALLMLAVARWQRGTVRTQVPGMHFWRCIAGVISLCSGSIRSAACRSPRR